MPIIGKSLAHYEISRQIGKSEMGEVYRRRPKVLVQQNQ
jgi:hypothetical protein